MEDIFKVIFQLDADSKQAVAELDKVNSKYKETNDSLKRQQAELTKVMAREAELIAGRAKANNPTQVVRYNAEIAKAQEQIKKLNTEITTLTKTEKGAADGAKQFGEQLKKAFDNTKAQGLHNELKKISNENKNLANTSKDAFGALRAELRQAKSELIEALGSGSQEQIQRASQKVGELKDKMNDLNETTSAFASGSKFQQIGNLFGDIGRNVLNLDFGRANEQSKALLATTRSITFAEAGKGLTELGSTLLNLGKALLTNPIFLIGSAVALIISNFDALKNSGGIVGQVFKALAGTVDAAKEAFLSLTDAIGLTNNALDKFNEKKLNNLADSAENIANKFERIIKLQQAQGKDVIELEKQKTEALLKNTRDQIDALAFKAKTNGKLSDEDFKRAKELAVKLEDLKNEELVIDATIEKKKRDKAKERADSRLKAEVDLHNRMADLENKKIDEDEAKRKKAADDKIQGDLLLHNRNADLLNAQIDKEDEIKRKSKEKEKEDNDLFHKLFRDGEKEDEALAKKNQEDRAGRIAKEEADRKKRVQDTLNDIQTIANATFNAANLAINAKIKEVDKTRSLQEKRVQDAKDIADKGNAELLELEQNRLDDLNKKRESFVRRQQQLATLELIANTAIAISKAAAQGGVAAGVTIAATLVALVGGLIQAREIASSAAFYEGGYTGDGDPKKESKAIGKKPYTYHKGEFVFDHQKTGKYRPIFEDIHKGNIDLNEWKNKVVAYETVKFLNSHGGLSADTDMSTIEDKLDKVIMAISGQATSVSLNENGLEMRFKNIRSRNNLIRNVLARA